MRLHSLALALLVSVLTAQSQAPSPIAPTAPSATDGISLDLPDDPSLLLGMGLGEAWMAFGTTERVYSVRGEEPWQDDVVFEYESGFSLFWFGERLWQIRFIPPYPAELFGFRIGGEASGLSSLGRPSMERGGFAVYDLPYRGYPVRLRARTEGGRIAEAYVYRADF